MGRLKQNKEENLEPDPCPANGALPPNAEAGRVTLVALLRATLPPPAAFVFQPSLPKERFDIGAEAVTRGETSDKRRWMLHIVPSVALYWRSSKYDLAATSIKEA